MADQIKNGRIIELKDGSRFTVMFDGADGWMKNEETWAHVQAFVDFVNGRFGEPVFGPPLKIKLSDANKEAPDGEA